MGTRSDQEARHSGASSPKTARGRRTINLSESTVAMLLAERERHLRICAGVPDGSDVVPALVRASGLMR